MTVHAQSAFFDGFERPLSAAACTGATPLVLGSPVDGTIDPAGQADLYRVSGTTDQWIRIAANASSGLDPEPLDPVIGLFQGAGEHRLALNDDDVFGFGRNSALIYHSPAADTYCLKIEDYSTFARDVPAGGPDYAYQLGADALSFGSSGVNLEAEPNESAAAPQTGLSTRSFGGIFTTDVAGLFGSGADVDAFRVNSGSGALTLEVRFAPHGPGGYGSSVGVGTVDVVAADGVSVIGRLNVALGARSLRVPALANTNYHVVLRPASVIIGSNPFYFVEAQTSPTQNQQEANDIANGAAMGAEIATPFVDDTGTSYFVGGTVPARPDLDWWSFQAMVGQTVTLECASRRIGSGVDDASFRIYRDPVQAPLQQENETEITDVRWTNFGASSRPAIQIATSGTHYLRVGGGDPIVGVSDRHYDCRISVLNL